MLASRMLGWALVVGLTAAGLVAIWVIATGDLDDTGARVLTLAFAFALYSWTASRGMSVAAGGAPVERAPGVVVVIGSAVALGLAVPTIWSDYEDTVGTLDAASIAGLLTLSMTHLALTARARRSDDRAPVRLVSWGSTLAVQAAAIVAALLILSAIDETDPADRVVYALFVLGLLLTLLSPLLRRLMRATPGEG